MVGRLQTASPDYIRHQPDNVNINKYAEYRCDAYAVKYGCGEGLLSFLRRLKRTEDVYGEHPTFTEYIMSTHPSTEKRIARLEKLL